MDEFYACFFDNCQRIPAESSSKLCFWGKQKSLVDLRQKPSPNRRNQPKAMARAIRIFLALDLLPEMDFFVSPNIYDARFCFFLTIGLGENRLML